MKELYLKYKIIRVLIKIIVVILILILLVFLFLKLWQPFGGTPSKEDKKDYEERAINYKDGLFSNENDFKMIYNDDKENQYVSNKGVIPIDDLPIVAPSYKDNPSSEDFNITWFGHSTVLMQMHGMNILIDPVFSEKASPVSFAGPSRYSDIVMETEELPNIDIVVISHDHYDHLDYKTIKEIDSKVDKYIVPLGVENHLERWGVDKDKIINLAWWEEVNINGLLIAATPAKHYSGRNVIDMYNNLWASWVFIDENYKVFTSGDSGFDKHFEEIYNKYGEFDFAMLESGQYDVKWRATHMTPEESVEACKLLKAKVIMPIHWGAFKLANHPWDDSVERFTLKADEENIDYITPMLGETINYEINPKINKWWTNIK